MGEVFDAVATNAEVHKPAVVIQMEIITDYTVTIKSMQLCAIDMPGPFTPAQADEWFVEMVVAHEGEA